MSCRCCVAFVFSVAALVGTADSHRVRAGDFFRPLFTKNHADVHCNCGRECICAHRSRKPKKQRSCFLGVAPPQAAVVTSIPAVLTANQAVIVQPQALQPKPSAAQCEIAERLAQALAAEDKLFRDGQPAAATSQAAGSGAQSEMADFERDLRQLQSDVDRLNGQTATLIRAVDMLIKQNSPEDDEP